MKLKNNDKCAIIIQARMSSERFPGKMMSSLFNMPLIEFIYRRCKKSSVTNVLAATSVDPSDDAIYDYCKKNSILVNRGSLNNVVSRYIEAGELLGADFIIRVCGDTPLVDIFVLETLIKNMYSEKLDYVAPSRESCAAGFYSEAVRLDALKKIAMLTNSKDDLEHVTKFIIEKKEKFLTKFLNVNLNPAYARRTRLTIDYREDLDAVNSILGELPDKFLFKSTDVLNIVKHNKISSSNNNSKF